MGISPNEHPPLGWLGRVGGGEAAAGGVGKV